MNKLNEYMNNFFTKGVHLLCSDQISNYNHKLTNEKSFICGSFWAISSLLTTKSTIKQEDLIKVLRRLRMCIKTNIIGNEDGRKEKNIHFNCVSGMKGFSEFTDINLYENNIQSTLYAIQINYMVKKFKQFENYELDEILLSNQEIECIIKYIRQLYDEKLGCFYNDERKSLNMYSSNSTSNTHFKADLRHTMAALCTFNLCYKILGYSDEKLTEKLENQIDVELTYQFLRKHFNDDGGVSLQIDGESNVAACFCCIGSMILLNRMELLSTTKVKRLVTWLLERISISGGINGRVGKSSDICYIWWNLATLMLIKKYYPKQIKLFNENVVYKILEFIQTSQNEDGGFSYNRSTNVSDPYHSFTAILSMSLLSEYLGSDGSTKPGDTKHNFGSGHVNLEYPGTDATVTGTTGFHGIDMGGIGRINPLYALPFND